MNLQSSTIDNSFDCTHISISSNCSVLLEIKMVDLVIDKPKVEYTKLFNAKLAVTYHPPILLTNCLISWFVAW